MPNILVFQEKPDYAAVLEKKGHKVFHLAEKAAALDCGRTQKLDLALVEADQPAGLEVMQELRQLNPELRLLAVTGSPSLASLRQAINLGVQEILFIPLDTEELESKVANVAKATKRNLKEPLAL
jgi:ActR/RegA family two-component response regulator